MDKLNYYLSVMCIYVFPITHWNIVTTSPAIATTAGHLCDIRFASFRLCDNIAHCFEAANVWLSAYAVHKHGTLKQQAYTVCASPLPQRTCERNEPNDFAAHGAYDSLV